MRELLSSMLLVAAFGAPLTVSAQQVDEQPVVYVTQNQVPWDRVDSLTKLLPLYPEWLVQAREQGHLINQETWIHRFGDQWNVVQVRVYPSWKAFSDRNSGWAGEIFRAVEPDSAKRAALISGYNWVYGGTIHRDNIYTRPKQ